MLADPQIVQTESVVLINSFLIEFNARHYFVLTNLRIYKSRLLDRLFDNSRIAFSWKKKE